MNGNQTTGNTIHCRGVRGAVTVEANTADAILAAAHELLNALVDANDIQPDDVGSVIFSTTRDLTAEYPAVAARQIGWHDVALLCTHEMAVPHGLAMCLRILIMWNTARTPQEIQHVYLREAQSLRPDRSTHTAL
ncbi:MAG: chorismate mutase [Anaerolineae bacterium]|nr:chorismate mutase [Anaerolineae bacterium]